MRLLATFGTVAMLVCVGVLPAHADKRVALVIGNGPATASLRPGS